jgi:1-acyl-sn-glycerol-3-phosphate acyltransferase
MDKTEGAQPGQTRRPAARRTPTSEPAEAKPCADVQAQQPKRVHARRSVDDEATASEIPQRRAPAVRAAYKSKAALRETSALQPARIPAEFASTRDETSATRAAQLHSDAAAAEAFPPLLRERERTDAAASTALARAELADEFGLDPAYETRLRPLLESLCRNYFRVQIHGAHHIPRRGRVLLVCNHSRSLAWDGILLRTALRMHHDNGRELRWLVEDHQYHTPFLGTFLTRLGAVRACQDNAERLLQRDELVAVFPEGTKAAEKRFEQRHRLQRFGRGGYVKLALRTGSPVIPVALVGNEDGSAWLDKLASLSRWVRTPLFAWGGLSRFGGLALPPLPSRWTIVIGEPIHEIARQDADATRDDALIHELNECARSAVQQLLDGTVHNFA